MHSWGEKIIGLAIAAEIPNTHKLFLHANTRMHIHSHELFSHTYKRIYGKKIKKWQQITEL